MADKTKIIVGCTLAGALLIGGGLGIGLGVVKPMKDKDNLIERYEIKLVEYQKEIENYKQLELDVNLLEELKVQVATNKTTIGALESDNAKLSAKITEKEAIIAAKLDIIAEHEAAIRNKDGDIAYHLAEIDRLKAENNATQAQNASLQASLNNNTQTINTLNEQNSALNTQILGLNTQIVNLMVEFQKANNLAIVLNNKVITLQGVIDYYEQFISTLETSEQAVVTFKLPDGSIHNLQIVNKGAYVTVSDPVVDNATFNYWTLDGEQVTLAETLINSNTTFVADMTYSYTIKFFNGTEEHNSQQVAEGGTITAPEDPTKENHTFKGWSLDGVTIVEDLTQVEVSGDLNFVAIFERSYTTFVAKTWNANFSSSLSLYGYGAWTDGTNYYNSRVGDSTLILDQETDTWSIETIGGVSSFDGSMVFNLNGNTYLNNDKKTYKFNKQTSTWEFFCNCEFANISGSVWVYNNHAYASYNSWGNYKHYILNEVAAQWESKVWNGFTNFSADELFIIDNNVYYSSDGGFMGSPAHYKLNAATDTFEQIIWNGLEKFSGNNVYSNSKFAYCIVNDYANSTYSYYRLDAETNTCYEFSFNGYLPTSANSFWECGEHTYYSEGNNQFEVV